MTLAIRCSASASETIASPSRLRLSCMPSFVRRRMWRVSDASSAGITSPRVSARIRRRTSGITSGGARRAARDPAAISRRSTRPSEPGMPATGERSKALGRGRRAVEAQHLVGQTLDEVTAGWIGDEATETRLAAPLPSRESGLGAAQELVGDLDGPPDACVVVHRPIMARRPTDHRRSRRPGDVRLREAASPSWPAERPWWRRDVRWRRSQPVPRWRWRERSHGHHSRRLLSPLHHPADRNVISRTDDLVLVLPADHWSNRRKSADYRTGDP